MKRGVKMKNNTFKKTERTLYNYRNIDLKIENIDLHIERLLNDLSADDVMRIELMNGIAKYISDSTVSLIGIPNFNCPVCGELQKNAIDSTGKEKTYPRLTEVLALDTYQVFFTLVEQRRLRISQR